MAWIDEEYADEVAVVSTWLVTFLPWSVSYAAYTGDNPVESLLVFLRFPVFELQARFPGEVTVEGQVVDAGIPETLAAKYGGIASIGSVHLGVPPLRLEAVEGTVLVAHALWSVAAVLTVGLFVLSLAMYLREDAVSDLLPVGYVRLTSIAFGVLTLVLVGATVAFALSDAGYGTPVPVGLPVIGAFAVLLWRAEQVPSNA